MIISLLMNLLVAVSAYLLTYKIFRFEGFIDSLLSFFILCFSQIILTQLALGIPGRLYLANVFLLNLLLFLVIWFIARDKGSSFNSKGIKGALRGLLADRVILLVTCVVLGFALVKFFFNLFNPPLGWDNLNYHFTFPVEWMKHGNLDNPITVFDDPSPTYYPINGSLIFLWLMLPLKNVFLADLGQVPFFIMAFLAVYSISKKLGLDKRNAYLAACLFTLIPNYFKQMRIAYVDVMVAALFLACLNSLFLLNGKFSLKNVFIYALSFGLLLGVKTVALPYCGLLFIPFIYLCFKNLKMAPASLILFLLFLACLGAFSYIRNFVDTGNPLYPLDFNLFGKNIFKGVIDSVVYGAHFKIEDYRLSKLLFHEGLGAQSLIFILPGMFLALPLALKKGRVDSFNNFYFLILPFLIYFVYRYIIPLANTRYLYPLFGVGMAIGFYVFVLLLNTPKPVINILVIICLLASVSELGKRHELVFSILAVFPLLFFLNPALDYAAAVMAARKAVFIPLSLVIVTLLLISAQRYYIKNEYPGYSRMIKYSGFWPDAVSAWQWLNSNTNGDNIAYAGRPVPFPLYGASFKNNVYYVSVNRKEPAKLQYFPNSRYSWGYDFVSLHKNLEEEGNYRSGADYSLWLENLAARKAAFLFIYSLHQTQKLLFPLEDNWAKVNPGKFNLVFTNETVHIYRIMK